MNTGPAPFVNKLILLVLSGILACLVSLVVRTYKPIAAVQDSTKAPGAEATDAATTDEIVPPPAAPPKAFASRPARPVATNASRPVAVQTRVSQPPSAAAASIPDSREPTAVPVTQILPVVTAVPVAGALVHPPVSIDAPIFGVVTLTGTPRPEVPIDFGPSCGKLQTNTVTTRHYVVGPNGQLANVLVYLKAGLDQSFERSGPTPLLDQVGCMFEPYMLAVMAGQSFEIRNSDPEIHSIHATPRLNRNFYLAQSARSRTDLKKFDHPELFVRMKCDVHPWMFAYVNVLGHPFYSVTDTNGFFALPAGLPPGRYTVSAIHLRAGEKTQEVEIGAGERKLVNFRLRLDGGRVTANSHSASPGADDVHAERSRSLPQHR